jgi:uncharacterized protein
MPPTLKHGKICYLELPTTDVAASSAFYERVFGWHIRHRDNGAVVFDDPTREVSGHWVTRAAAEPGLLVSLWVDDLTAAIEQVQAAGCPILQPPGGDPGELTAHFRDPGGNVMGLYQEPV